MLFGGVGLEGRGMGLIERGTLCNQDSMYSWLHVLVCVCECDVNGYL